MCSFTLRIFSDDLQLYQLDAKPKHDAKLKFFLILVLTLLVDCDAIGDRDYLDYNYQDPDYGAINVKTTSLVMFSASVLVFI